MSKLSFFHVNLWLTVNQAWIISATLLLSALSILFPPTWQWAPLLIMSLLCFWFLGPAADTLNWLRKSRAVGLRNLLVRPIPSKVHSLRLLSVRFLRSERGTAYVVFWAFMLPMLLALIGLGADVSRVQAVHTKLQTSADAAALAAVQTAQPVLTYSYVPVYDANGNLIGLQRVITGDTYEIQDPDQAGQAADTAFNLNMQNMTQSQNVTVRSSEGQIYSRRIEAQPANRDSYTYWASANVLTFYLGPAMKMVDPNGPDYSQFPVSVVGTASVAQPVRQ